jgi:hypothetical protein
MPGPIESLEKLFEGWLRGLELLLLRDGVQDEFLGLLEQDHVHLRQVESALFDFCGLGHFGKVLDSFGEGLDVRK